MHEVPLVLALHGLHGKVERLGLGDGIVPIGEVEIAVPSAVAVIVVAPAAGIAVGKAVVRTPAVLDDPRAVHRRLLGGIDLARHRIGIAEVLLGVRIVPADDGDGMADRKLVGGVVRPRFALVVAGVHVSRLGDPIGPRLVRIERDGHGAPFEQLLLDGVVDALGALVILRHAVIARRGKLRGLLEFDHLLEAQHLVHRPVVVAAVVEIVRVALGVRARDDGPLFAPIRHLEFRNRTDARREQGGSVHRHAAAVQTRVTALDAHHALAALAGIIVGG